MSKVQNMISPNGNSVANQFHLSDTVMKINGKDMKGDAFQSYASVIVFRSNDGKVYLDESKWDYSATTGRYRNGFLNEGIAETRKNIKSGKYELVNLN